MQILYPCIKYKIPADPKLDGTDFFIVAESMNFEDFYIYENFTCSLSFTCENDQKAFYQLIEDCIRFEINAISFGKLVNTPGSV